MTAFLITYFVIALAVIAAVYIMSLYSEQRPQLKTVLLIVYILALIGVIFATGCLEGKYGFSRLKSSAVAVLMLLLMYLADNFGGKKSKEKSDS